MAKYKVTSGGWCDTQAGTFHPRGSVVDIAPALAAKFLNAFEPVDDKKAKVSAGVPIDQERQVDGSSSHAVDPGKEADVETVELPEGAEDATELFENEVGAQVFNMPDGSFLVRAPGQPDKTLADSEEVRPYFAEVRAAQDAAAQEKKPKVTAKAKKKGNK